MPLWDPPTLWSGQYLLTLDFPCYHAVTTYVDDENLREEIYRAFVTRASDQGIDGLQSGFGEGRSRLSPEWSAPVPCAADLW